MVDECMHLLQMVMIDLITFCLHLVGHADPLFMHMLSVLQGTVCF